MPTAKWTDEVSLEVKKKKEEQNKKSDETHEVPWRSQLMINLPTHTHVFVYIHMYVYVYI